MINVIYQQQTYSALFQENAMTKSVMLTVILPGVPFLSFKIK